MQIKNSPIASLNGIDGSDFLLASADHNTANIGANEIMNIGPNAWKTAGGIDHPKSERSSCLSAKYVSDEPISPNAIQNTIENIINKNIAIIFCFSILPRDLSKIIESGAVKNVAKINEPIISDLKIK
jgi:hypothetical protein